MLNLMNRLYVAITLIGILGCVSFAQDGKEQPPGKPDFNGTWEIEDKKSNPLKYQTLIIYQAGDELTLTESFEYKGKLISNKTRLYADGRGEQNLLFITGADFAIEVKSTTSWKKAKLIRKSTSTAPFMVGGNSYTEFDRQTQTYSLSKDGNSLVVETSGISENPLSSSPKIYSGKRVYQRKK
jgi:hypothetical protein